MTTRRIAVGELARVEGEGGLAVRVVDGVVTGVELDIYEPPRFFEAFLRGRRGDEAVDITARICGICPVAYQMSACAALESAAGVAVSDDVIALRRLLYCGEWIQSHALHVYLLHAPDFLGLDGVTDLADQHRERFLAGAELKRIGNEVMTAIGGRPIHPVNVRVGGFHRAPTRDELAPLRGQLEAALDLALETVDWVAGFTFPAIEIDALLVAVGDPAGYPFIGPTIRISDGRELDAASFDALVVEEQVPHSTALHARLGGSDRYLAGPLARYSLASEELSSRASEAAARAGLGPTCRNPFRSIVVRAVEMVHACETALALIDGYQPPEPSASSVALGGPASGCGVSEAPRGLLLHRYDLDADGVIEAARIVPPTSQNQLQIETDLRGVVDAGIDLGHDELTRRCEQAVRNHDPCISCATHFLDLRVEEGP